MGDISDYKNDDKMRREYSGPHLSKSDVADDPVKQFEDWFDEALNDDLTDANAMQLATATKEGRPSVRTVLLKGFDERGFQFYTNYKSRKGRELQENTQAAVCFYWAELNRQVRIEGVVKKTSKENSADYFAQRPRNSQLSAHASKQSHTIKSRQELEDLYEQAEKKYEDKEVPLPDHWGGYLLGPSAVEFWQGRPSRLHDRIVYEKKEDNWVIKRLAP